MQNKIIKLKKLIEQSNSIVFFGGAGVSTESGIPDFRSADGLFNQDSGQTYQPEDIVSDWFLKEQPELFFNYYFEHLVYPEAVPNATHLYLAELEAKEKDITIITQNIDGLHQAAGSEKVLELHGSTLRNTCLTCGENYPLRALRQDDKGIPRCPHDNGIVRPDVVLYGEMLDQTALSMSMAAVEKADLLIVAGTSLSVYPANSLIHYFKGEASILLNRTPVQHPALFDLIIQDSLGSIFKQLKEN
ncbi:NAD-dependent protein deacylase [Carnobacterium sp. CS13]|uniref:NAD-dependent protein deacylase n=1 Tax=Carnobacterium sp. CS13 TaxID=2800128 RepID=UPI001913538C|nr:NAD-dependent protein deacylase [Carnobacterium sp. CS13]QQP71311.1 NAD-dependent protein deacylase [Carnobacterium sp. CS13]